MSRGMMRIFALVCGFVLTMSFSAQAAKKARKAHTLTYAFGTSVTAFQPEAGGAWMLVYSTKHLQTGEMRHQIVDPVALCMPSPDMADIIQVYKVFKPGKVANPKSLPSLGWVWKMESGSDETGHSETSNAVIYRDHDGALRCMNMHNSDFAERKKTRLFKK